MDQSAVEVLRSVRKHIEDGWTQKAYFRDANGKLLAASAGATSCCLQGAFYWNCLQGAFYWNYSFRVSECFMPDGWLKAMRAVEAQVKDRYNQPLLTFNDTPSRTKEEVLAVVDAAIATLDEGSA